MSARERATIGNFLNGPSKEVGSGDHNFIDRILYTRIHTRMYEYA
jgi:hypothetical protein